MSLLGLSLMRGLKLCYTTGTGALPSARSTRQSRKNTRQRLCRVSHLAKKARQTVHRQSLLCRVLFIGHSAKRFAECQGALDKEKWPLRWQGDGDGFFAECQGWHSAKELTLPSVCPVALGKDSTFAECPLGHSTKSPPGEGPHVRFFAECSVRHSAKRASLPSANDITLAKVPKPVPRSLLFAECYDPDTRQSTSLPSVTLGKVTSIYLFIYFLYSIHTNKIYHIYTSQISSQT
jgi:hypothetical protein